MHPILSKLHGTKGRFEVIVTSYGRNKNLDKNFLKNKKKPIIAPAFTLRLLMTGESGELL